VRALRGVLARPLYSLAAGTTGGVSFRLHSVATPAGRLRSWPGQSWSTEDGGLEDGPVDLGRDADLPSHHLPPRLGVPAGS